MPGSEETTETVDACKKICFALQSEDKFCRKRALVDLQKFIASRPKLDESQHQTLFNETQMYTLNAFRDKTETVRSQAIKFMSFFLLEILQINDYYLTYIFPVVVERIGTPELVEESEEIRFELLQFVQAIILKYSGTNQLKPFLNDCVVILCEMVIDKHPDVKLLSCQCVTNLAQALPRDFHTHAETLVKPVLSIFGYQRYKIRIEAVKCMGDLVMNSKYKALEVAVGPMAERLFDQIPLVRQTVIQVAARWLLEYVDRYSFFQKLLPLLLTGINDEVEETRKLAHQLWQTVGLQFEKENENDLKDQLDFLTTPPKYYPEELQRPPLGCRVLVQRNVGKIAPALARELTSWQSDVRVRCSQLLCALALYAEEGLTQHLQELLLAMYISARDEDNRVVVNVVKASELIGLFVPIESWKVLVLPAIEDTPHYGHLSVLAGLIGGCPKDYIASDLLEICKSLSDNSVCRSRKAKYQRQLIECVKAILSKCNSDCYELGEHLFIIVTSVISLRDEQNVKLVDVDILDDLYKTLGFESRYKLWSNYTPRLLNIINHDPLSWSTITEERCIFETVLTQSGTAFGENLQLIAEILGETLNTNADAESRLKTFFALSIALDNKDDAFKNADRLEDFLHKLLNDVLVPTLVWHAGRTAEAMRTIAGSCLCSTLSPGVQVDLFPNVEVFGQFFDNLLPLLLSLTEDASYRSRILALEALTLLKETAVKRNCWKLDDIIKVYPDVMKRLDDPTDAVRIEAIKSLKVIFKDPPVEFTQINYKPHHELLIDTLLTHFDDDNDENVNELISECIKQMFYVAGRNTFYDKVNHHKELLRNKTSLEKVLATI